MYVLIASVLGTIFMKLHILGKQRPHIYALDNHGDYTTFSHIALHDISLERYTTPLCVKARFLVTTRNTIDEVIDFSHHIVC